MHRRAEWPRVSLQLLPRLRGQSLPKGRVARSASFHLHFHFLFSFCTDALCQMCFADINECDHPSLYPCRGNCRNTFGSYNCLCPQGTHSDDPKSIPCSPIPSPDKPDVKFVIGITFLNSRAQNIIFIFPFKNEGNSARCKKGKTFLHLS